MKEFIQKGYTILLDDEDFEWVSKYNWQVSGQGKHIKRYYVRREFWKDGKPKKKFLHRMIMGLELGDERQVDHINGNGLDNRKKNLRICFRQQNNCNRRLNGNNTSGYKGVYWDKNAGKWKACIGYKGKLIHIGLFENKIDAVKARIERERELFGEFSFTD